MMSRISATDGLQSDTQGAVYRSRGSLKPASVNRSESTKPLARGNRLESESSDKDHPNGDVAQEKERQQEMQTIAVNGTLTKQKSPHKVNRTESTKPLVKDRLGSEGSDGGHSPDVPTVEPPNAETVLDDVFEGDEVDGTHPSTGNDKKIEERLEQGKKRRSNSKRTESTKPLTGTRVSDSSA